MSGENNPNHHSRMVVDHPPGHSMDYYPQQYHQCRVPILKSAAQSLAKIFIPLAPTSGSAAPTELFLERVGPLENILRHVFKHKVIRQELKFSNQKWSIKISYVSPLRTKRTMVFVNLCNNWKNSEDTWGLYYPTNTTQLTKNNVITSFLISPIQSCKNKLRHYYLWSFLNHSTCPHFFHQNEPDFEWFQIE